ncbi:MAG: helix-turn-helix transcriptional regulator [Pseudomonadota bacterium]
MKVVCCLESISAQASAVSNWTLVLGGAEIHGIWSIEEACTFAASRAADLIVFGEACAWEAVRQAKDELAHSCPRLRVAVLPARLEGPQHEAVYQPLLCLLAMAKDSVDELLCGISPQAPAAAAPVSPVPGGESSIDDVGSVLQVSRRQKEVLRLLLQGLSNKRISNALGISVNTVKAHVAQILRIAGVNGRGQILFQLQRRIAECGPAPLLVGGACAAAR